MSVNKRQKSLSKILFLEATSRFTSGFHRDVYHVTRGNGQLWFYFSLVTCQGIIKPLLHATTNYVMKITIYGPPREDFSSSRKAREVEFDTWYVVLFYSCYLGFTGSNCSQYDCFGVEDCTGRGTCIQPNLCECSEGYEGESCSNFTCEKLNRCSGWF